MFPKLSTNPKKKSPIIHDGGTTSPVRPPPRDYDKATVAVELEFVLIYPVVNIKENDAEATAKEIARQSLENAMFQEKCEHCEKLHAHHLPLTLEDQNDVDLSNDLWSVSVNPDIGVHDSDYARLGEHYVAIGIRITSRTFDFNDRTPCPDLARHHVFIFGRYVYHDFHDGLAEHSWSRELGCVDEALHRLNQRPNYRVLVNEFTGFNVLLGNKDGVHLDVAKNAMGMLTAFERLFDSVSSTKRIGGGAIGWTYPPLPGHPREYKYVSENKAMVQEHAGLYCIPMSTIWMTSVATNVVVPKYHDPDIPTWLHCIYNTKSRVEFERLQHGAIQFDKTILNINRVWDNECIDHDIEFVRHCKQKPSIEFRLRAGTLDYDDQRYWILALGHVFKACFRDVKEVQYGILLKRFADPDFTFSKLLAYIRCSDEVIAYFAQVCAQVNDPTSPTPSPSILNTMTTYSQESHRNDHLHHTAVPTKIIGRNRESLAPEHVREKIRHKFHLGLYGRFPPEFVYRFFRDRGEIDGFVRGDAWGLTMREVSSSAGNWI